jgi:hypothetical protein
MTALSDIVFYSVPGTFVFCMGIVLINLIMKEPGPWVVKGPEATIDTGSRVITMLAPTVIYLLCLFAGFCALIGGAVFVFMKRKNIDFASLLNPQPSTKRYA